MRKVFEVEWDEESPFVTYVVSGMFRNFNVDMHEVKVRELPKCPFCNTELETYSFKEVVGREQKKPEAKWCECEEPNEMRSWTQEGQPFYCNSCKKLIKPTPKLPGKIGDILTTNYLTLKNKVNALIDYLKAKEVKR